MKFAHFLALSSVSLFPSYRDQRSKVEEINLWIQMILLYIWSISISPVLVCRYLVLLTHVIVFCCFRLCDFFFISHSSFQVLLYFFLCNDRVLKVI